MERYWYIVQLVSVCRRVHRLEYKNCADSATEERSHSHNEMGCDVTGEAGQRT